MPVQDWRPLALAVASIFSFSVTPTHSCGLLAISETTQSPVDLSMWLEWEIMCETLFTSWGSQGQMGWCVREKVWWTDRCRPRRQDQLSIEIVSNRQPCFQTGAWNMDWRGHLVVGLYFAGHVAVAFTLGQIVGEAVVILESVGQ